MEPEQAALEVVDGGSGFEFVAEHSSVPPLAPPVVAVAVVVVVGREPVLHHHHHLHFPWCRCPVSGHSSANRPT